MSQLEFARDKEKIDYHLFQLQNYTLADIALSVNQADAFLAINDGQVTAQCLVSDKKYFVDVTHFAYTSVDEAFALLQHIISHYKDSAYKFIEMGCGNSNLELYAIVQRAGFRVTGVVANYYVDDKKTVQVENAIVNLDMIRFRFNLVGKGLSTIGYNASGVK